jgi:hypothetical protein
MRAALNEAFVAREPDFSEGLDLRNAVIPRRQIVVAPNACDKLRFDTERGQLREREVTGFSHMNCSFLAIILTIEGAGDCQD